MESSDSRAESLASKRQSRALTPTQKKAEIAKAFELRKAQLSQPVKKQVAPVQPKKSYEEESLDAWSKFNLSNPT